MMELIHYSDEPVILDRSRLYAQDGLRGGIGKPSGLWVSVAGENDWKSWCEGEEFDLQGLTHPHRITLTPKNNILYITSGSAIDEFHKEYSTEREITRIRFGNDEYEFNQRPINWELVSDKFDGIIIAPYIWSHRYDGPFWYYGWDCASGCIWNLDAIKSMETLRLR